MMPERVMPLETAPVSVYAQFIAAVAGYVGGGEPR